MLKRRSSPHRFETCAQGIPERTASGERTPAHDNKVAHEQLLYATKVMGLHCPLVAAVTQCQHPPGRWHLERGLGKLVRRPRARSNCSELEFHPNGKQETKQRFLLKTRMSLRKEDRSKIAKCLEQKTAAAYFQVGYFRGLAHAFRISNVDWNEWTRATPSEWTHQIEDEGELRRAARLQWQRRLPGQLFFRQWGDVFDEEIPAKQESWWRLNFKDKVKFGRHTVILSPIFGEP